jgi:hypothetical protein
MKILVLAVLVASSFISARAQERIMERSEFDAAVRDDKDQTLMWAGKIYRMIVLISTSASDRPASDYSSKTIFEHGPDGSSRSYLSSTFGGKKTETTETLRIGRAVYIRKGAGPWKTTEPQSVQTEEKVSGSNSDLSRITSSEIEYRFLGPGEWKGEKVNLYLRTEQLKETDASTGKTRDTVRSNKYWINPEGLIFRSEYRFESATGGRLSHTLITVEREMDPNIIFVEPQITPQQ